MDLQKLNADNMKENNILNKEIYKEAMIAASKVDSLESKEEIKMYATSLYNAMIWGRWVKETKKLLNLDNHSTLGMLQKIADPLGLPLP